MPDITAAAAAMKAAHKTMRDLDWEELAAAAWPHLATGTLPRCPTPCDSDCAQACHEVHQIPRRQDHHPETCVATLTAAVAADATRAERQRCAQLAEQRGAVCARDPGRALQTVSTGTVQVWHDPPDVIPFADLLRQEGGTDEPV